LSPVWDLLSETYRQWRQDNAQTLGAALAFYTMFSLAPLLIIVIAIFGVVLGKETVQLEILRRAQELIGAQGAAAVKMLIVAAYRPGTGLAATVYYRKELLKSFKNFMLMGVAPTLGAILFALILVKVLYDDYPYKGGEGASYTGIHGIGGVFLMGVGTMVVGVILMVILWIAKPEFFKRRPETWPGEGQPIPYSEERVSE